MRASSHTELLLQQQSADSKKAHVKTREAAKTIVCKLSVSGLALFTSRARLGLGCCQLSTRTQPPAESSINTPDPSPSIPVLFSPPSSPSTLPFLCLSLPFHLVSPSQRGRLSLNCCPAFQFYLLPITKRLSSRSQVFSCLPFELFLTVRKAFEKGRPKDSQSGL